MTGSTVVRTRRLPGASSAALHRLDLADGSRLVLRRYAWRAYREAEPEAPQRETDALCFARSHGLAVPEVVAADVTGDHVGDGVRVVLVAFLPGRPEAVPDLGRLAEVAASIHEISADDLGHEYFPWYEEEMTTPPPVTERRGLWELAIELWRRALTMDTDSVHQDQRTRSAGVADTDLHGDTPAERAAKYDRTLEPDPLAELVHRVGPRVERSVAFGTRIAVAVPDEVEIDELGAVGERRDPGLEEGVVDLCAMDENNSGPDPHPSSVDHQTFTIDIEEDATSASQGDPHGGSLAAPKRAKPHPLTRGQRRRTNPRGGSGWRQGHISEIATDTRPTYGIPTPPPVIPADRRRASVPPGTACRSLRSRKGTAAWVASDGRLPGRRPEARRRSAQCEPGRR
jgi:hypothetical protein